MFKKGQVSIELIIIILFLITFIYVYETLAEQTVYSLELSRIKEQEQNIALSLNEYFQLQKNATNVSLEDYETNFSIPEIKLASKTVPCKISITNTSILVEVDSEWVVSYNLNTPLPSTIFGIPQTLFCGQKINCDLSANKIVCSGV